MDHFISFNCVYRTNIFIFWVGPRNEEITTRPYCIYQYYVQLVTFIFRTYFLGDIEKTKNVLGTFENGTGCILKTFYYF